MPSLTTQPRLVWCRRSRRGVEWAELATRDLIRVLDLEFVAKDGHSTVGGAAHIAFSTSAVGVSTGLIAIDDLETSPRINHD
jgi:hypothetical protein